MKPVPSQRTIELQKRASDPAHSAFVEANAGSGKTFVLVDRVVRLLLGGVPPDRILCLTFTRAAAAQMQMKVAKLLGEWATLPDEPLRAALAEVHGRPASEPLGSLHDWHRLAEARRLFARALETPGGLKIQTIHAFCERLVHQFPFEANVAAGFEVMEERETRALQEGIKAALYAEAGAEPDGPLGKALAELVGLGCEGKLPDVLDAAFSQRGALAALFLEQRGADLVEGAVRALARTLGIDRGLTVDAVVADFMAGSLLHGDWQTIARELEAGNDTNKKHAASLRAAARTADANEKARLYLTLFLTTAGEASDRRAGGVSFGRKYPTTEALLASECSRVAAFVDKRRSAALLQRTAALWRLADRALKAYAEAKARRGAVDFDDLIAKTRALLTRAGAGWVLYKLDGGIDHLLIDEAQDTSPDAWQIVQTLAEEFTAGAGARAGVRRTLFAVGDEKQSIYRFQGADPEKFGEMHRRFETAHKAADLEFASVALHQSFRSAATVLAAVDHVFTPPEAHTGLESGAPRPTVHESARPGAPGVVELWPLAVTAPEPPVSGWDAPFTPPKAATSPVVKLADDIAAAACAWIDAGVPPGEILILVRQRKAVFEAVLRSLKARRLPVAGADRLVITDHIAVMDLLALGDALVSPDDDLALACALKSPLFGLDDDDLLALAPKRRGRLRDALVGEAVTARQRAAASRLVRWEAEAKNLSPFEFFTGVLGRDGGRRDLRARLGGEADDALDALLLAAEEFCERNPPTMPGFLAFVRAGKTELKRDLDVEGGEIRVMTVHGAKGLEAEVVVVAETGTRPYLNPPPLLPLPQAGAPAGAAPMPVWAPRQADDPSAVGQARDGWKEKERHEHKRLLYVALTRAKDRLFVTGHKGPNKLPEGCWYERVEAGLGPHAERIQPEGAEAPILRLADGMLGDRPRDAVPASPTAPDWLLGGAEAERAAAPALAPSGLVAHGERPGRGGTPAQRRQALLRGALLHRLLEHLPAVEPARRREVAERLVGREPDLPAALREEILGACLAILEDARFATLFGPAGRTEIALVGRLAGAARLSGRIDRLLVEEACVTIVDYKSDAVPPAAGAPPPETYVAQLAAYRLLLRKIYPGREVRCALLWTAAPRLDEIDPAALDAVEQKLSSAAPARAAG